MVQSFGATWAACCSGGQKIGIQREHAYVRAHSSRDVDERNILRAEARCDGRVRLKLRESPAHDFFRAPTLRAGLYGVDFFLCRYAHHPLVKISSSGLSRNLRP